jgi:hypothetical protein
MVTNKEGFIRLLRILGVPSSDLDRRAKSIATYIKNKLPMYAAYEEIGAVLKHALLLPDCERAALLGAATEYLAAGGAGRPPVEFAVGGVRHVLDIRQVVAKVYEPFVEEAVALG